MSENVNNIPTKPERTSDWSVMDVRSEEVQEIIGRPPHWLVRWGITAFLGVLALVFLSAAIIKYPEVIDAPIRLTAIEAPQTLESRVNGKIVRLRVENNSVVEQGDILAWMESTASHEEVVELSAWVDSMRNWLINDNLEQVHQLELSAFGNLGEIQTTYQNFEQSYREFLSYLPDGYYDRQHKILNEEMEYNRQLLEKLHEQKEIQQADYELARREYEIQKKLAEKEFLAPIELARAESELSSRLLPLRQTESAIINNYASQTAKEKEIMELEKRTAEQRSVFLQSLNILKSAIDEWKKNYLITAPFTGKAVYTGIIRESQSVSAGQDVFYIQPDNTYFFGELTVSQQSAGKIKTGQQVLVRFHAYPYYEFGSIHGEVEYFSDFPVRDSLFFAKVQFPDGLVTSYGRQIQPRNGMTGRAEIVTQDMRLLERVYNNITKELR